MTKRLDKTVGMKRMKNDQNQKGTATIIAVMIMSLMTGFVALAVARTTSESGTLVNDIAESRTFAAAQASLENMTLNADSKFETKLDLTTADITAIQSNYPTGFTGYFGFNQTVQKIRNAEVVDATGDDFQGLKQIRDEWELTTTVTEPKSSVQSILQRRFFNNRIPLFQFGIFYDDDLEFHPGPRFDFGGRVHANGNLFLMAGTGLYFSSRVSTNKSVVSDVARNGRPASNWGNNVFVKDGAGNNVQLTSTRGSASNTVVNGANIYAGNADMPPLYPNANWASIEALFQKNLVANARRLDLPIKVAAGTGAAPDYVEIVKRGKVVGDMENTGTHNAPIITPVVNPDSTLMQKQRYANGSGLRISLSDSKARLPGCATAVGACGVQLDAVVGGARGYIPRALTNGVTATRVNGERLYNAGKENWIKVELVDNNLSSGVITATDVTEDILSLGVTDQATTISSGGNTHFTMAGSDRDSRSIIKLQRFIMPGAQIKANSAYLSDYNWNSLPYNLVVADDSNGGTVDDINPKTGAADNSAHQYNATIANGATTIKAVPFPITMFDTREGLYNDDLSTTTTYPGGVVPQNGVMSMVDIDVFNLKRFLRGDFNTLLPTTTAWAAAHTNISLKSTDVPDNRGWVCYVSDRRGDFDFDGEYDMEDIFGNNDGILQKGEDVNNSGNLQANYTEAPRYSDTLAPDVAAVVNPTYYRRGVRLVNGTSIPGSYIAATPQNTKGFAFASENGIYVQGNYNATGVTSVGTPTPPDNFLPHDTVEHIPASIAGDAVTILSNAWRDSNSFKSPFNLSGRDASDTTVRFAMLAGDAMSSLEASPNQGGGDPRLGGGVHNFKRFLETWGSNTLSYSGSLINMFNSRNNNGAFKCCSKVYSPPARNWVFDITFLDLNRLPPATPFFQSISLTGFERVNE